MKQPCRDAWLPVRGLIVVALGFASLVPWVRASSAAENNPSVERRHSIRFQRGTMDAYELRRDLIARRVLIQFREPVSLEDRHRLEQQGVKLLAYIPDHTYWAGLAEDASHPDSLAVAGGVVGWGSPPPVVKLSLGVSASMLESPARTAVRLTLFPDVNVEDATRQIHEIDSAAQLDRQSAGVFRAELQGRDLPAIAALDTVQWIEPAIESITLDNANSAELIQIPPLHQDPPGLSGNGIRVAVFDRCYPDLDHPDFGGRISIARYAQWCIDEGLFNQSHATHVAGTVASSGVHDDAAKGMAPGGYVYAYNFHFGHVDDLVDDFAGLDVRLSNHSYSWKMPYGAYEQEQNTLDDIIRQSDAAMFWSSGNDGYPLEWGGFTPGGWTSQRNGGLAKNSFSVCATNKCIGCTRYLLKLDSSRGPTLDGRVKPEFCAQGAQVYSLEPGESCGSPPCYGTKGGTSMASPALAGGGALLHELYEDTYGTRLPLELLRAVLIHSAIDLHEDNSGRYHDSEHIPSDATIGPDYVTGWGLPDFTAGSELLTGGAWSTSSASTGAAEEAEFHVDGSQPLRVTLAWVDAPGAPGAVVSLVNDLDLELEDPEGTIHHPWILDKDHPGTPATRGVNDVDVSEQVVVDVPLPGTWTTRVRGTNLPGGGTQDYALVVTGATLCADEDGDRYADCAAGTCTPPAGVACGDCRDDDPGTHPGADESCDGNDNTCSGTVAPNEIDGDGDGYVECSGWDDAQGDDPGIHGGDDCDDDDPDAWSKPSEVIGLRLGHSGGTDGTTTLTWSRVASPGGAFPVYDVASSDLPADFVTRGTCVAADTSLESAADPGAPGSGEVRYFVVLAETNCGRGTAGFDSQWVERSVLDCEP